jgi:uncharacterized metal-binding protein
MPNVRAHDAVTLLTGVAAVASYVVLAPSPALDVAASFATAYLFAGYACAGDLDLDSAEYRRWGRLRFLWWPYRQLMPHRSRLSHGVLLGGLLRILYLLVVALLIGVLVTWAEGRFQDWSGVGSYAGRRIASLREFVMTYPRPVEAGIAGFVLAGTVHTLTDLAWSRAKRLL